MEIFNVTFDGLYKFSTSFITCFQSAVQTRVATLEEKVLNLLEMKYIKKSIILNLYLGIAKPGISLNSLPSRKTLL